jgi:hypothetical protein
MACLLVIIIKHSDIEGQLQILDKLTAGGLIKQPKVLLSHSLLDS